MRASDLRFRREWPAVLRKEGLAGCLAPPGGGALVDLRKWGIAGNSRE